MAVVHLRAQLTATLKDLFERQVPSDIPYDFICVEDVRAEFQAKVPDRAGDSLDRHALRAT